MNIFNEGNRLEIGLYVTGQHRSIRGSAASLLRLLLDHPEGLTRLEMLRKAPLAIAFSVGKLVRRLRQMEISIEAVEERGRSSCRREVRFARYRLASPVDILIECLETPSTGWHFRAPPRRPEIAAVIDNSPTLRRAMAIVRVEALKQAGLLPARRAASAGSSPAHSISTT